MSAAGDGRRALFSAPSTPATPSGPPGTDTGREALFSTARRTPGTVVVECSRCERRSRMGAGDLVRAHVPVWAWIPVRSHPHWIRCPACGHRTWVRINWLG